MLNNIIPRRAAGGGKSVFELKSEYEKEYNPFFYHYTRMDHSKVSEWTIIGHLTCHMTLT